MIAWKQHNETFNGKPVSMELRPLKRKHFAVITALIALEKLTAGKTQEEISKMVADDPGMAEKMIEGALNIQEAGSEALKDCVQNLQLDGEKIDPADLGEEMIYTHLALAILRKLTDMSSLTETDQKNSQGPSSVEAMDTSSMTM